MKWLAFVVLCVALLVSLGVLAVDEPDVAWEGRKALCPHCRAGLEYFAVACRECNRTFDWRSRKETCRHCLDREEVKVLQDGFAALELEEDEALPAELKGLTRPYLLAIEEGACTFCGGIGNVMAEGEKQPDKPCPICRGDGLCIGCNGDRVVTLGDRQAHLRRLERDRIWDEAVTREKLTGLTLLRGELVDDDVDALRGHAEAATLVDQSGNRLLDLARDRVRAAFVAIRNAVEKRGAATPEPAGASNATDAPG
ncbi:MAG: hypothetical protein ACYTGN_03555 [Planctomycetota bacterium]|jgi:hypothetical protein